jgi:hypothetical protein
MSVSLGANGGTYQYPQENDPAGWGDDATDWASAVSAALSNIGLGASVSSDAVVNIISTSKGILVPRMTTTQRNAIGSPSTSLLIYNTTTTQYELYTGSTWQSLASYINGTFTVTGAASLQSTLNVTGSSTFANTTVNGTLSVTGGTTLASITGTSAQLNSLSVTGSSALSTLSVTGNTTLASITGTNTTINGTLSVTGNTTLASVTGANVTATGTILAASGTSGSPSVASSGDTDTGMYWSAANELTFSTGGNPRLRIESTGQLKAVYESQVGTDYNTTLHNGYLCRAWVNFNGTGSGTITPRASGNVTSVTKNATGDYTVNFTTAMPDADYSVIASCGKGASVSNNDIYMVTNFKSAPVSGSVNVASINGGRSTDDAAYISIGIFR